ncbi:hypothetical protein JTB14_015897 [Gonioctena quinquepunctata]|nr:hypothetical protein JTB14_015897 [Gonioctena quinquepunctata]
MQLSMSREVTMQPSIHPEIIIPTTYSMFNAAQTLSPSWKPSCTVIVFDHFSRDFEEYPDCLVQTSTLEYSKPHNTAHHSSIHHIVATNHTRIYQVMQKPIPTEKTDQSRDRTIRTDLLDHSMILSILVIHLVRSSPASYEYGTSDFQNRVLIGIILRCIP